MRCKQSATLVPPELHRIQHLQVRCPVLALSDDPVPIQPVPQWPQPLLSLLRGILRSSEIAVDENQSKIHNFTDEID
jgi:hypothetical protein